MSVNTLHEFDDKQKMIREMERVVKKGGLLLIVDFRKEDTGFGPPAAIRVSRAGAVRLFEGEGFSLLKMMELPFHYSLVFAKP